MRSSALRAPSSHGPLVSTTALQRVASEGRAVVLESVPQRWSRRFLELAGSAPDFPYPPEPEAVEPGPDLDE